MNASPIPHTPVGHLQFVTLVAEPPQYELYAPGEAPKAGLSTREFRGRVNLNLAIVACWRLRAAGSVMERFALRDLCSLEMRGKYRTERAWWLGFRLALYGARRHGWLRTFSMPRDFDERHVPGAPCARCRVWLTPHQRAEIACQRETPYSALPLGIWQEEEGEGAGG